MDAALIIIGDEILSGTTMDTNSKFIATELKTAGIAVRRIFTVPDEAAALQETISRAFETADLVITTGGLGPTNDDRTKKIVSEFFKRPLVHDAATYENLQKILKQRKREHLLAINSGQAEIIEGATVFQNDNGTAPGQMIEQDGKIVILLPGVPYETKPLMQQKVLPYLMKNLGLQHILSRIVSVIDIPESLLSEKLQEWEHSLPQNISLSYLPVGTRVRLKITASGNNKLELKTILRDQIEKVQKILGDKIISTNHDLVEEILHDLLLEKQLNICTAESCTGGQIAKLIASVSGSSTYFAGTAVTYKTEMKTKILGVEKDIIDTHGVVSEEVAREMCRKAQKLFGTEIAVSTTGAAGPNSDEFGTEVGTVFYTIRIGEEETTNRLFLPQLDRLDFIKFVSQRVLQDVITILQSTH